MLKSILRYSSRLLPDRLYIKLRFRQRLHRKLDLKNPVTFNEKLQWLKLYDRDPKYTDLVDKYEAKRYIASIIGQDYVVPNYGVWNSFDEIDFDSLPDQFVLKCTHDSGGLVICQDKSTLDMEWARQKIETSMKENFYHHSREWAYKNVKPRIIAEKYIEDAEGVSDLTDYKFYTFNGEPKALYVSQGLKDHSTAHISFYDLDGKKLPFKRDDFADVEGDLQMPSKFEKMKEIAELLAKDINTPFVRIDLYQVDDKIYFSEITFCPCGGYMPFNPKEWDKTFGDWLKLPL